MNRKTDLAVEAAEELSPGEKDGYFESTVEEPIPVTRIRITKEAAAKSIGKPIGTYATVFFDGAFSDAEKFGDTVGVLRNLLREFLGNTEKILAVGLGNAAMSADSLGPNIIDRLAVSRHLKRSLPDLYRSLNLSEVSALRPGVAAQTGMETAEWIRSAVRAVEPEAVIVFDSLASRRVKRLCATVQINDSGITPGSGVGNTRCRIDRDLLGIPVIGVGIPTVVDAATLTIDTVAKAEMVFGSGAKNLANSLQEEGGNALREAMGGYKNNLIVTPQDIDALVDRAAKMVAKATNLALHPRCDEESLSLLSES